MHKQRKLVRSNWGSCCHSALRAGLYICRNKGKAAGDCVGGASGERLGLVSCCTTGSDGVWGLAGRSSSTCCSSGSDPGRTDEVAGSGTFSEDLEPCRETEYDGVHTGLTSGSSAVLLTGSGSDVRGDASSKVLAGSSDAAGGVGSFKEDLEPWRETE